jgi:glycosyltransferase involved in cell wall biosynthesis
MYKNKKIGVVVPAYNEEKLIASVIDRVPDYIDRVYVVNDASQDKTGEVASQLASIQPLRVIIITHRENSGVGRAIVTGYKGCLEDNIDIAVVMAGDNQMEPSQLPRLLDPIIEGKADYTVGDRLSDLKHMKGMSLWRRFGNWTLRWLTRISAWNFSICDPQNGYTAVTCQALQYLDLDKIYPRYGYCNDILVKFSATGARIKQVRMPAVYGNEKSKIKYWHYIPTLSWLLLKDFFWRISIKVFKREKVSRSLNSHKSEIKNR